MSQPYFADSKSWGPPVRAGEVRIGDAERDRAVAALSDHFVAGRLTQVEFEERSEQATRARYGADLAPLFADLPDAVNADTWEAPWMSGPGSNNRRRPAGAARLASAGRGRPERFAPPPFFWLAPVLLVGLVTTAVLLTAPWVLWFLFALAFFGPHHKHHHRRHWSHHHR